MEWVRRKIRETEDGRRKRVGQSAHAQGQGSEMQKKLQILVFLASLAPFALLDLATELP